MLEFEYVLRLAFALHAHVVKTITQAAITPEDLSDLQTK